MKSSNYVFSLVEYILEIIIIFVLFRIVIKTLGMEYLGVWSIAMSITALTSIGSSGFASSAVKFVAQHRASNDFQIIKSIISTTFVTVIAISAGMSTIAYTLFSAFGTKLFSNFEIGVLDNILHLVFLSFIFGSTSRVLLSSLDGLLEIRKRSITGIISKIVYFVSSILLITDYGLYGLGIGLVAKELTSFIVAYYFLNRRISINLIDRDFIKLTTFREIFNYGYKFQLNSIIWMLTDPLTKFLIKEFGGLSLLGLFEVLYKIFWQTRMLILVVMNTYLPYLAGRKEKKASQFYDFFNVTYILTPLLLSLAFAALPVILEFLKIQTTSTVYFISICLYISIYINLISTVAYILNLAEGNLTSNLNSTLIFATINLIVGYISGRLYGFTGVILAWGASHIVSSSFLIFYYIKRNNHHHSNITTKSNLIYLTSTILTISLMSMVSLKLNIHYILSITINLVVFMLTYLITIYNNQGVNKTYVKVISSLPLDKIIKIRKKIIQ